MRSSRFFDDKQYIEIKTPAQIREMLNGNVGVVSGTRAPVNSPAATPFVSPLTSPRVPSVSINIQQSVDEFERVAPLTPTVPRR